MDNVLITHLKDKKGLVATMVAARPSGQNTICIGWSKYKRNYETVSFIKKKGRDIAIDRVKKIAHNPKHSTSKNLPFIIDQNLSAFVRRAFSYFRGCDEAYIFADEKQSREMYAM